MLSNCGAGEDSWKSLGQQGDQITPRGNQWHPTPELLPGESRGRRSPEGCGQWGRWGSDTTEQLYFHFSLSCMGKGNGNPLQCSCLENPRDGGAWWAAVYGVTQSQTWLKWLSSSSSRGNQPWIFIGMTDTDAEAPILWPPDGMSRSILEKTLMLGKIENKRRKA